MLEYTVSISVFNLLILVVIINIIVVISHDVVRRSIGWMGYHCETWIEYHCGVCGGSELEYFSKRPSKKILPA